MEAWTQPPRDPNQTVLLVLTHAPDFAVADSLAKSLVEARLAACVNVMAECRSVYRWKGAIETASEVPLMIKTCAALYPRVEAFIREHHPYELPEIVALPVAAGLPAYLDWILGETQRSVT